MREKSDYSYPKKGSVLKTKNNFDNINFGVQTIDKVDFKSLILSFEGWFIVDVDYKPHRKMEKLLQQIKNTIKLNSNKHYFNGMLIDVIEIPYTFEAQSTGYVTFEYTLFVNKGIKFNKQELTTLMNEMIDLIYNDYFKEPIDFDVYKNRIEFNER
jgi:hypothetical protein